LSPSRDAELAGLPSRKSSYAHFMIYRSAAFQRFDNAVIATTNLLLLHISSTSTVCFKNTSGDFFLSLLQRASIAQLCVEL